MRHLILAVLVVGGSVGPVMAQTAGVLRPEARPVPEAPMRPVARAVVGGEAEVEAPVERVSTRSAPASVIAQSPIERAEALMQAPSVRLLASWEGRDPKVRPDYIAVAAVQPLARAPLRPFGRPHQPWMDVVQISADMPIEEGDAGDPGYTELAVALAMRPPLRPPEITRQAERIRAERARGAICGSPELQGDVLGSVPGNGACGVSDAVRVRSVGGVRLSTPATINCDTARALLRWVQRGAIPAVGNAGGGLASLRVVSHYSCRNRNNQAGGRLSEHSFGRAIDIAAFGLRDGTEITVLRGWNSPNGERLRQMWRAACGPFGTVLGPNANRFHRDHFHFDTATYRSGSYCR